MGKTYLVHFNGYFCAVKKPINIALLISGNGSNARNLVVSLAADPNLSIQGIISNNGNAAMETYCAENQLFFKVFHPWSERSALLFCKSQEIDVVVLAGFLRKISGDFISAFPLGIINIHPSLLPNYGGKGMYGHHVHQAVWANNEDKTGITVHLVNEQYDDGEILLQQSCDIADCSSPYEIEQRVRALEHHFFPLAVAQYCSRLERES
jgi:phosphoribosylglycinamide formyltransferase 1